MIKKKLNLVKRLKLVVVLDGEFHKTFERGLLGDAPQNYKTQGIYELN